MAAGNNITVVGNLTRDPELRFTNTGMAVATVGVAVNFRRQKQGEWEEEVSFFDVTAFGELGENAAESLNKGNRVIVSGRLQQRSWETQDGDKRSKVEIVADEIGPSLRWAVADVKKVDRRDGDGGGSGGGGNRGGGGRPIANEAGGGGDYDEEPF